MPPSPWFALCKQLLPAGLLCALAVATSQAAGQAPHDWPGWRGPTGQGTAPALPLLHWSASTNVLWQAAVPGEGHASPVVRGERVLVSTALEPDGARVLLCYHRTTGALLWRTVLHVGGLMARHEKNSHASATPVCDDHRVYVPYIAGDALWLSAIALSDGRIDWQPRLGPFVSEWGYASSPALYGNLVIISGDNKGEAAPSDGLPASYLVAVDRQTGKVVWRAPRPSTPNYASPVVAHLAGRDQLLIAGAKRITSYDPGTGKERWSCRWSAARAASSVACGDDCVYASANYPRQEVVCVRADGAGDVTSTHLVWRLNHDASDVSSPLYHAGRLYLVTDNGVVSCLDAAAGRRLWRRRVGGRCSASATAAGEHLLITDENGTTRILHAGPDYQILASNSLPESVLASPALSGNRLFLRSRNTLWCLAPAAPARTASAAARPPSPQPLPPVKAGPPQAGSRGWTIAAALVWAVILVGFLGCFAVRRLLADAPVWVDEVVLEPAPTHIVVRCSGCRRTLRCRSTLAGKRARCPGCSQPVPVPPLS